MLKWSLSVPLGSLTVWACSFPNIAKFQFLHQADRDNHTVKNLHSWLNEMTFPFLRIRKATTLASQWLISRNLGGSIAKKKKKKAGPRWRLLLDQFLAKKRIHKHLSLESLRELNSCFRPSSNETGWLRVYSEFKVTSELLDNASVLWGVVHSRNVSEWQTSFQAKMFRKPR